jgi:hypothetical protein
MEHETTPDPPSIRIEYARDEAGLPRRGLIVVYVDGQPVGSAAKVAGTEEWVAQRPGDTHVVDLSEVSARELLLDWARAAVAARTEQGGSWLTNDTIVYLATPEGGPAHRAEISPTGQAPTRTACRLPLDDMTRTTLIQVGVYGGTLWCYRCWPEAARMPGWPMGRRWR